ncbi:MAG: TRAP transporter substrate-binding protein DctP [Peptococcaceae bacterium]|nr:TRAP transporter substrate-binding protein DctP [Peptococcaceae bacterium]
MKKKVLMIMLVLLLAVSPAACSSKDSVPAKSSAPASTSSTPAVELKIQYHLTGTQFERVSGVIAPMVEKLTNGTVKIKSFPAGALVPVPGMLDAVRTRTLDMAVYPEGIYAGVVPVCEIAGGLPFAFPNLHESWIFMWHRGFVDILREEYAKQNVYVIPWETFNVGLMTKKPITQVADIKGMKFRSHSSVAKWLEQGGASVVNIPSNELYTALSTGVVDGANWGDAGPMYEMKFQEVVKNYLQPEPGTGAWNSVMINMDVWNKFTPEQKTAVEAAFIMAGRVIQEQTRAQTARALDSMVKDFGVKVNRLSEEEQAKAVEMAAKSWEEIAKKNPRNAEVINKVKAFVEERKNTKQVVPTLQLPW